MAASLIAFVPSRDLVKARAFYVDVVGLTFVSEDPFAVVVSSRGVTVRIANVSTVDSFTPYPFTILGWSVEDIAARVGELAKKGVSFQRYDGMKQDDLGIWSSPSGALVAWFADPDGNVLSLTQNP
ncbi:MAG: VOC family protein [Acidimicrobiales bacterium]|nr:VOC family protein [Acidimicrobiales bacterium]